MKIKLIIALLIAALPVSLTVSGQTGTATDPILLEVGGPAKTGSTQQGEINYSFTLLNSSKTDIVYSFSCPNSPNTPCDGKVNVILQGPNGSPILMQITGNGRINLPPGSIGKYTLTVQKVPNPLAFSASSLATYSLNMVLVEASPCVPTASPFAPTVCAEGDNPDIPETLEGAKSINTGQVYKGTLSLPGDRSDVYKITIPPGKDVSVELTRPPISNYVVDIITNLNGSLINVPCTGTPVSAAAGGTKTFKFKGHPSAAMDYYLLVTGRGTPCEYDGSACYTLKVTTTP